MSQEFNIVITNDQYTYILNKKTYTDVKLALYAYKKSKIDINLVDISLNKPEGTDHAIAIFKTFMSTYKPRPYYPGRLSIAGKAIELNGEDGFLKKVLDNTSNKALFSDKPSETDPLVSSEK